MDYKPTDVFVGLVDFFAIVLPGAMLTFLLKNVLLSAATSAGLTPYSESGRWVAFLLCAYLFGQFIQLVAALFMDRIYDKSYLRYRIGPPEQRVQRDPLYARAKELADPLAIKKGILKWARASVLLKSGDASAELDRLEATSKFFRGVCLVLIVYLATLPFMLKAGVRFAAESETAVAALLALSFWRFCEQRWKFTEATYLYFIQLHNAGDSAKAAKTGTE